MGSLVSGSLNRPTSREILEKLEQQILDIDERRWGINRRGQFVVQILHFSLIAVLIVIVCILTYPSASSRWEKFLLCVNIGIIGAILWLLKWIVQWYSRWSAGNEEARLRKLRKEKERILEVVCDTETYRVATEILEKYDSNSVR